MDKPFFLYLCALLTLCGLCAWFVYWQKEARKLKQGSYSPPPTSWFAEWLSARVFSFFAYATVGQVTALSGRLEDSGDGGFVFRQGGAENVSGRVIYVVNHATRADGAVLHKVIGRHLRVFMDSSQLGGIMPYMCALAGVISVHHRSKEERTKSVEAAVEALSAKYFRIPKLVARSVTIAALVTMAAAITGGAPFLAYAALLAICLVGSFSGSEPGLAIAPEGALLPDNPELSQPWYAGAVRIARQAQARSGEPVKIVPVALCYRYEPKLSDWGRVLFSKTRKLWPSKRHPSWQPEFQVELDSLPLDERPALLQRRAEIVAEFEASHHELFGAVVACGNAIEADQLPADEKEATEQLRRRVLCLLAEAQKH